MQWITHIKQAIKLYDQALTHKYEASIKRELAREDDMFYLLCFSEILGIPNPMTYYTLELYPYFLPNLHAWHQRMGMDHSPFADIQCC